MEPLFQRETPFNKFRIHARVVQKILKLPQKSWTPSTPMTNSITSTLLVMNTHSSTQNGKSSIFWILDTSATYHITSILTSFSIYHTINPIYVTLHNSFDITTCISGSVVPSSLLTIHNVLYIPTFIVNLISMAKLTIELNYHLLFHTNAFHIM